MYFTKPLFFLTNFNRTLRESSITAGPPIWPAAAQPQKSTTEAGREGGTDGGFHTRWLILTALDLKGSGHTLATEGGGGCNNHPHTGICCRSVLSPGHAPTCAWRPLGTRQSLRGKELTLETVLLLCLTNVFVLNCYLLSALYNTVSFSSECSVMREDQRPNHLGRTYKDDTEGGGELQQASTYVCGRSVLCQGHAPVCTWGSLGTRKFLRGKLLNLETPILLCQMCLFSIVIFWARSTILYLVPAGAQWWERTRDLNPWVEDRKQQ